MTLFVSGSTPCCISGRTLSREDDVVLFPVFHPREASLDKYVDSAADFKLAVEQPEYPKLVAVFRKLSSTEDALYQDEHGSLLPRALKFVEVCSFPLLLTFRLPMESLKHLLSSDFTRTISKSDGAFEDRGVLMRRTGDRLIILTCPSKYTPSSAPQGRVHHLSRTGRKHVDPFIQFLARSRLQ